MRSQIGIADSIMDVLVKMAEGNPGAVTVMTQILKTRQEDGPAIISALNDMNIRGSQIWVGFKDHCNSNIDRFIKAINERDPTMVNTINEECYNLKMVEQGYKGYDELATTHGPSMY